MSPCLFDEPLAEGAGSGEVDGELRVAVGAFRRFVKEIHVVVFAASSILCVFHPLRGLALKNIANSLLSIMGFLLSEAAFLCRVMNSLTQSPLSPLSLIQSFWLTN